MADDILVINDKCFVCASNLPAISKSVMINLSQKPLYKFIESFTGRKFNAQSTSKASLCEKCFDDLSDYDSICKRAALIQERIADAFKSSQKKFHEEMMIEVDEEMKCATCFAVFTNRDEMYDHACIIDEEEFDCVEYICEEEDEEFQDEESKPSSSKDLKKSDGLVYSCTTCNKPFTRKKEYAQHVKLAHLPDGAEVYTCSLCETSQDNIFVNELELKLHNVIKHPEDRSSPLACPACPKVFNNKALLTRHFGLHLQDKPLVCDICGKRYFHTSSFHMHLIAHKGIKGHTCSECGKSFISTSHLNRHLKTHTGIKAYECHECGSRFALRYNLRAHLNSHYGIVRKRKPKKGSTVVEEIDMTQI